MSYRTRSANSKKRNNILRRAVRKGLASNKLSPLDSAVAHRGNTQDRAASPPYG
ncbi:MAG: hypothetical protein AAF316_03540 [Cyanobacteria bacterium P01_A01_bin.80]